MELWRRPVRNAVRVPSIRGSEDLRLVQEDTECGVLVAGLPLRGRQEYDIEDIRHRSKRENRYRANSSASLVSAPQARDPELPCLSTCRAAHKARFHLEEQQKVRRDAALQPAEPEDHWQPRDAAQLQSREPPPFDQEQQAQLPHGHLLPPFEKAYDKTVQEVL